MKFREILRFEFAYQLRRVQTWLFFLVLAVIAFLFIKENYIHDARNGELFNFLNAPWVIAAVTVFGSLFWLLVAAPVAGDAAARDVQTRMHPLIYTAPVSKAHYLGGRFLAAFVLNALILLAVPVGILLALHSPGVEPEILSPSRPATYLTAYTFLALPSAFVATAIQFSLAALSGRTMMSYVVSVLLFITAMVVSSVVAGPLGLSELGTLLDPIGPNAVVSESSAWTPLEKNTRLIQLEGLLLWNRLLWIGIALGMLAFTHHRFRFAHPEASTGWSRLRRRPDAHSPTPTGPGVASSTPISVPKVPRTFGFRAHARQTLAIAWTSFGKISKIRGALLFLAVVTTLLIGLDNMKFMGVPLLPTAGNILTAMTTRRAGPGHWIIIPLVIVFLAGQLVWREREAGLSEMADAAPVPEWVFFLGKFLRLGLVLVAWTALLMTAGLLVQMLMGDHDFEIGLYLQSLFGIQLVDYLLLGLLALVLHAVVNQKHVGHLVTLIAFGLIAFAYPLGIRHNLLVYGSDPGWSYSDMRGFAPFFGPWLWFKLYWAAWALLLAVVARLLWVRGKESSLGVRLQLARRRFTGPTILAAVAAVALVLTLGGFIFYNTNVLNEYETASDRMERRAEYERRYGQYEGIPQPRLTGTNLHVEIYPERREVELQGTYRLVNNSAVPIDSVHLATLTNRFFNAASRVETGGVEFDRPARLVLADKDLGHRIYALEEPLQPGDSLRLSFEVQFEPHGFRNRGVDASVVASGTYFTNQDWLPAIGYQPIRELRNAGDRRAHGLAPRPAIPSLDDIDARGDWEGAERIAFEAVVGTAKDQMAVAPGALRRTWTEGGRRYCHYSTDAPIGNEYAFFSADYAVHEAQWNDVAIQIFHHPGHAAHLNRMVRSVRASLNYYTEQFGPYPHRHIRLVERPGPGMGLHADASNITYGERFPLLKIEDDPRGLDLVFAVVSHEVAHQWWGSQLPYARVEGAALLTEGLATYSEMRVVEKTYGHEHLRRLLSWMRVEPRIPRTRAGVPLLRATGQFNAYRRGPFAIYALSEYIGEHRVNEALRRMLEKHGSGAPPLPTSLDLYRELQAVTPDSLQYLLHDLFEANTFWELKTERATAEQTEAGTWQVTLDVQARKVVVDSVGVETPVPIDDWVEIGVVAPAQDGEKSGVPLYKQMHRIRSAKQTITVTVPRKPARAGVEPYHLLIDGEMDDNIEEVEVVER